MRSWNKLTIGVFAVVLAVAVAGGAYATWGGDGDGPDATTQSERQANPDGALGGDDADIAASCIEGAVDCVDTPLDVGEGTALGMCAPGVTDCVDMVVGEDADCAADAVACGPDVFCDDGSAVDGCETSPACIPAEPAIEPEATMTPDELEQRKAACAPQPVDDCDDAAGQRCLPPDCAVSSDSVIACPDGGGGASDDGASPGAGADAGGDPPGQIEPSAPGAAR